MKGRFAQIGHGNVSDAQSEHMKRRCHFLILTDKWYKMQRVGIILT